MRNQKHIGSRKLERNVEAEYEGKGYGRSRSKYIAGAVAGKVYREQKHKGLLQHSSGILGVKHVLGVGGTHPMLEGEHRFLGTRRRPREPR